MATVETVGAEHESSDRKLRKALSFQDLFFLSMGGIIGSGWLLAVLGADGIAGPAVVLSWIIGGILVLFIALTYAEVAGMLPRSGAIVRYPHLTHGSYTGYMLAWAYFLTAVSVPTIEAEAVVTYASNYIKGLASASVVNGSKVTVLTGPGILFGLGLTLLFFLLNYFGIRLMGKLNTVITWWKFIIPALTFILLFFVFKGSNFTAYG
ncbi:MAG TPA: APC family permease, partial [Ktedonobacteraceae bacterium]|nr:APC family permease [Ktedonobacteraceae bacterium]